MCMTSRHHVAPEHLENQQGSLYSWLGVFVPPTRRRQSVGYSSSPLGLGLIWRVAVAEGKVVGCWGAKGGRKAFGAPSIGPQAQAGQGRSKGWGPGMWCYQPIATSRQIQTPRWCGRFGPHELLIELILLNFASLEASDFQNAAVGSKWPREHKKLQLDQSGQANA